MAFKITLSGWSDPNSNVVVMDDRDQLMQVSDYLLSDDRHCCTPSPVTIVDEPPTHSSFVHWLTGQD